jgi:suppressor for copper-sensitivity B
MSRIRRLHLLVPPWSVLASAALLATCLVAPAADAQGFGGAPKARVELFADHTSYAPGSPARIAARVTIDPGWHVNSHTPTFQWLIPTELRLELPEGWTAARIHYPPQKLKTFAFEDEPLAVYDGQVVILADLVIPESVAQDQVRVTGDLSFQSCDNKQCLPPTKVSADLTLPIGQLGRPANEALFEAPTAGGDTEGGSAVGGEGAESGSAPAAAGPPAAGETAPPAPSNGAGGTSTRSLAAMLLLGVLGGLILNAMPCVLPVLSLKVFGLVRSAGLGRREVVGGALATAAGILVSFWALAGAAVAAKAAGAAVGWGVQFQNPVFVTFLLVVVVLFCLNLWGLFEIQVPQVIARAAGSGPREGVAGHLASGLFATLMATPCSAPFLGTAIAFALGQSTATIFAIFTAVGLGMASPYLVLAAAPGAARWLPKPGAWMDTLRRVMGFLLAAAAVWLLYVLGRQVSLESRAWIELTLLGISLFVWLRHRADEGGGVLLRRLAGVGAAVLALGALGIGWQARAATSDAPGTAGAPGVSSAGLIRWVTFDRQKAESLAASGQPVFVDVTADWCFTCKFNEKLVLDTPEVAGAFERFGVVPMRADWTNRDDAIGKFLEEHGRYGIPFYMLYHPGAQPHVFSELLTKERLLDALDGLQAVSPTGG